MKLIDTVAAPLLEGKRLRWGAHRPNEYVQYDEITAHLHVAGGFIILVSPSDVEFLRLFRWTFGTRGYAQTERRRQTYRLARVLLGLDNPMTGERNRAFCVDHIDGDPINNRRENLRICTPEQNRMNIQCRGYSRNPDGTFAVYIRVRKQLVYLGRVHTETAARQIRRAAELKYFGEFAGKRGKDWFNYAIN